MRTHRLGERDAGSTSAFGTLEQIDKAAPHALVVEDDVDLLELLGTHMRRLGCTVSLATTAADALQVLAEQTPDLAVIDVELPDMDGRVLIASLLANRATTSCRIVITSFPHPDDVLSTVDAVLAKPFDRADVDRVVAPLLATLVGQ